MKDVADAAVFSEREFYRSEFRGTTLLVAAQDLAAADSLPEVFDELAVAGARAVLLAPGGAELERWVDVAGVAADDPQLPGAVWRALRRSGRAGVPAAAGEGFAALAREVAVRLGTKKLVWIDPAGGLVDARGRRHSFVDRRELREWIEARAPEYRARPALCREVDAMLGAEIPAVNVCTFPGLSDELFTYAGSGTLFTPQRYIEVRRLSVDEYDAAFELLSRGVAEAFLVPRSDAEVERVLASGFGAFVMGRHLSGIGALLLHEEARAGEIACLYTMTRFLGEGVGAHLVAHAVERSRALGLACVFACTTSDRAAAFFERQGFARVAPERLPPEKWRDYAPDRRARVVCLWLPLEPPERAAPR